MLTENVFTVRRRITLLVITPNRKLRSWTHHNIFESELWPSLDMFSKVGVYGNLFIPLRINPSETQWRISREHWWRTHLENSLTAAAGWDHPWDKRGSSSARPSPAPPWTATAGCSAAPPGWPWPPQSSDLGRFQEILCLLWNKVANNAMLTATFLCATYVWRVSTPLCLKSTSEFMLASSLLSLWTLALAWWTSDLSRSGSYLVLELEAVEFTAINRMSV